MNTTGTLPGASLDQLPEMPSLNFAMLALQAIECPDDLYDPKLSGNEAASYAGLVPLIVRSVSRDTYRIVDGCKRFAQLRKHGKKFCACGILQGAIDENAAGLLRIHLNKGRPWHIREQVVFVQWLLREDFPVDRIGAITGISRHVIEHIQHLVSAPPTIIDALADGKLDLQPATAVADLKPADQEAFLRLIASLAWSFQTQKELLEWLPEIAYNQNTTMAAIVDSEEVTSILRDNTLNAPQKIERLRTHFYSVRFPRYSAAKKEWEECAAKVNPDRGAIRFMPSPGFEKNQLEVKVTLRTESDAARLFTRLAEIPREQWKTLICPMQTHAED
jgi:hypothetical protein